MRLAFDTGGTFTDFAFSGDDGTVVLHKVLSTPDAPARAVLQGVDEILAKVRGGAAPRAGEGALQILGATTVVTNAVLERKGVDTAFITTDGFQDMLRIRTEGRYDLYDLGIQYPEPLVPREHCFGVVERVSAHGQVMTPLDEAGVKRIAERLVALGIKSVAVCLLHAYKYPQHEQRVGQILAEHAPAVSVSLSSGVCPEVREYDRRPYAAEVFTRSLRGLLRTYADVGPDRPWRLAERVTCPTLLVYGRKDPLVDSRSAYRATQHFPDAHVVVLPDCGHVAQMEHPEFVAAAWERFCR